MNDLISKADAQVLTKPGFYRLWKMLVDAGATHVAAYNEVEKKHRQVDVNGESMYSDFKVFDRQHWRAKSRQRQQGARQGLA